MINYSKKERDHIKFLQSKGLNVKLLRRNKGHLHVMIDNEIKTTLPSTPSCRRSMRNSLVHINRAKAQRAQFKNVT